MARYEYKVHYIRFDGPLRDRERRLLDELNIVGQEGWRLNRLYPDFKLRTMLSWGGGLNMLLERQIPDPSDPNASPWAEYPRHAPSTSVAGN